MWQVIMDNDTTYHPVSCDLHSELELSIMHGKRLQMQINNHGKELIVTILPIDIVSRKGEGEFLLATDDCGQKTAIRLDTIGQFHCL